MVSLIRGKKVLQNGNLQRQARAEAKKRLYGQVFQNALKRRALISPRDSQRPAHQPPRERHKKACQNANDLAREAVGCMGGLGRSQACLGKQGKSSLFLGKHCAD